MFGYRQDEVLGQHLALLMPESHATRDRSCIERFESTDEQETPRRVLTVAAKRKDGSRFPIELSIAALRVDPQIQYAAFIRDISEKTELQERALQQERLAAVGMMTSMFAHEVGNPLNNIYLHAQMLQRRLQASDPDERIESDMGSILEQVRRLSALLEEFRGFYRRDQFELAATNVCDLITQIVEHERPTAQQQNVQIHEQVEGEVPLALGNAGKLTQVFLNLCKNAVEAMPDGGALTIRVARDGPDHVVVEFTDTGVGISPDVDVFEPFLTTKRSGTGLGLCIVRQIIEAHRGKITHTSALGKGTTFRTLLRVADA
jgi:PAS domain S-box-containing protein